MLTRCPNCETRFRITPEQLKLRQGKVRCGECQHIFNALDALIDEPGLALPVASFPCTQTGEPDEQSFESPLEPAEEALEGPSEPHVLPVQPIQLDSPPFTGTDPSIAVPPSPTFQETPDHDADPDTRLEPELHEDEQPVPRRWPWILASVFAVLALAMQAAMHFRVELAVLLPESRPALQAICDSVGCTVELPRNVELVSIENSDLHPDPAREKLLTLTATVKNRAPFAQTWPHLELTLTDSSDRPLARRILAPTDYLPTGTDIAAGFAPRREIAASVAISPEGLAANGYRLYLFYP